MTKQNKKKENIEENTKKYNKQKRTNTHTQKRKPNNTSLSFYTWRLVGRMVITLGTLQRIVLYIIKPKHSESDRQLEGPLKQTTNTKQQNGQWQLKGHIQNKKMQNAHNT